MSTLAQLSRQLDNALRAFAVELARSAQDSGFEFITTVSKRDSSDGAKITYSCGPYYGDKTRGNDAGATLTESRRRQGWNDAHEPMVLLEGPKAYVDEPDAHTDDPF